MGGPGRDVFVSYGHADADWVGTLAANLHRAGFNIFLDVWELVGGDSVTGRLEEGLKVATHGILVVSPLSLSRPWVMQEYQVLLRQAVANPARRLIPVLYQDAEMSPFLGNLEWVDFRTATTGPPYDTSLDKLVRSLQGRPAQDRPDRGGPTQWPQPPTGQGFRPAGPMQATLRVSPTQVTLTPDSAPEVTQRPRGLRAPTIEAVKNLHW